jgi:hypothetical protein
MPDGTAPGRRRCGNQPVIDTGAPWKVFDIDGQNDKVYGLES